MNKLDAELSLGLLQEEGYKIVDKVDDADVILFNTCSVRQHAEHKVYSHLGGIENAEEEASRSYPGSPWDVWHKKTARLYSNACRM